jgi:hypothetical protein
MKTLTKTVTVTIDRCDHCAYFTWGIPGTPSRELCQLHSKNVEFNSELLRHSIPEWCEVEKSGIIEELKGQIESLKEQLNDTKHQFQPRNFEG